jgi:hypothetical protein
MSVAGGSSITFTTPSYIVNSANVSFEDPVLQVGKSTSISGSGRGIVFTKSNNTQGYFGLDPVRDCFVYYNPVVLNTNNQIVSGTSGKMCLGDTTVNNLQINGNISGFEIQKKIEHLSGQGGTTTGSPSINITYTFINVISSGTLTGTMPVGSKDGDERYIFLSSNVTGGIYDLIMPTGRLIDPGSGTSQSKTARFTSPGQSIHLVWDNLILSWMIVNGGACIL